MVGDINVEDVLRNLQGLEGANGYVIFNNEGIPLKRSEKSITPEKAIHMAALISDFWNVSRKYIQRELRNQDVFIPPISRTISKSSESELRHHTNT